jgi:hypothetical protein
MAGAQAAQPAQPAAQPFRPATPDERASVYQALRDAGERHFQHCVNGHMFVVGDCGTLAGAGCCPDCQAHIGPGC